MMSMVTMNPRHGGHQMKEDMNHTLFAISIAIIMELSALLISALIFSGLTKSVASNQLCFSSKNIQNNSRSLMSCLSSSPVPVRSRVTGVSITIPGSVVIMVIPSHPLTAGCSLVTMLYNMGLTVKEEFLKITMNQNKWIWFRWRRKKRRQNYISQ